MSPSTELCRLRRPTVPRVAAALVLSATLGALLLAGAAPAHAAHPHYLRLLRQGTFALERGDAARATRDLRLACFGFLDEPPLLGQCLVRLGLAQAAADDDDGFLDTFRRVVEVEERFGGYAAADLTSDERADFEAQVVARIPKKTLSYSAAFARLAKADEPAATGAGSGTAPAAEDRRGADSARDSASGTPSTPQAAGQGSSAKPPRRSPPPDSRATERTPPAGDGTLSAADRADLDRARQLLSKATRRSDLDAPLQIARRVADDNPRSREAQHLTAVIAYRASRWQEAVTYFRRGGVPSEDNAENLFYYAVALYESGETEAAADAMRRSLPHLETTPFVERYRDRILGPAGHGQGS